MQQSLRINEILNFPLLDDRDLIKFLRFKFGFCDLEAGNILEQMKGFKMVSLNRDTSNSLNMKGLQICEGKDRFSLNNTKNTKSTLAPIHTGLKIETFIKLN